MADGSRSSDPSGPPPPDTVRGGERGERAIAAVGRHGAPARPLGRALRRGVRARLALPGLRAAGRGGRRAAPDRLDVRAVLVRGGGDRARRARRPPAAEEARRRPLVPPAVRRRRGDHGRGRVVGAADRDPPARPPARAEPARAGMRGDPRARGARMRLRRPADDLPQERGAGHRPPAEEVEIAFAPRERGDTAETAALPRDEEATEQLPRSRSESRPRAEPPPRRPPPPANDPPTAVRPSEPPPSGPPASARERSDPDFDLPAPEEKPPPPREQAPPPDGPFRARPAGEPPRRRPPESG